MDVTSQDGAIVVGWYMLDSKVKKMNWPSFVEYASKQGIVMKRLDPVVPISEQYPTEGPFSLLIYKLTDHLVKLDSGDPVHQQIISNFQRYEQEHPECVFIDVARAQERVIDRLKVYELLDGCMDGEEVADVVCPRFYTVQEGDSETERVLQGFTYPVICKTLQACGSALSHHMVVAFNAEQVMSNMEPPYLVQEYHNHNATVFKVFQIGSQWSIVRRPSIRNFTDTGSGPIVFNSQKMDAVIDKQYYEHEPPPPNRVIDGMCAVLERELVRGAELRLCGFDLLRNVDTGKYAAVDVNFFPGYIGYPNFNEAVVQLINERVKARRQR